MVEGRRVVHRPGGFPAGLDVRRLVVRPRGGWTGRSRPCPPVFPARWPPSAQAPLPAEGATPGRDDLTVAWRALPLRHRSYGPMRQTKTLRPPRIPPCARGLCRLLSAPAGDGPSRRYLCDPCAGARTHTPPRSSAALVRSLTEDTGLTPRKRVRRAGLPPHSNFGREPYIEAAVIRSPSGSDARSTPRLLRPRRCGHTTLDAGPPGLSHHAEPDRLPKPGSGVASCPTRTTDMAGLSPAGSQPCRLLPPAHGSPTSFTAGIRSVPPGPEGPGCGDGPIKVDQAEVSGDR